MTTKILFVDDDPNILQGLQRMLRPQRHQWAMTFCSNGQDALRALAEAPFDVLVSDMRMPGMSGVQLLTEVQRCSPDTIRIILSGQADQESLDAMESVAHRFLSKPCDAALLQSTVEEMSPAH